MVHKSLHLALPDQKPFDRDNWFESFVGNFVRPILDTGKIHQYWFSRYGRAGARKIRFRFSLDNYGDVEPLVNQLITTLSLMDLKDEEGYNWIDDLGGERFLQNNQRQTNQNERAQLVLDYLHSVSRLFVDSISHSDNERYFYQERNTNNNNPHGSIFESLHHLFCNMTDVTTVVVEGELDGQHVFLSEFYFGHLRAQAQKEGKTLVHKASYDVKF